MAIVSFMTIKMIKPITTPITTKAIIEILSQAAFSNYLEATMMSCIRNMKIQYSI